MNYRTEIDGLRAIAILPVIWMHAGLPFFSGGFLGVDVFFVISGFLITSILLKEFENNTFSLKKFYERRARRILPALITVILVTSIVVPIVTTQPKYLGDYGNSVISTMLFASNIFFWQTSGYFGSASELSPMLHTWSLAVEEQYYVFFPVIMLVMFSYGKKVIVGLFILISIMSMLIAEWGAANSPIGNFYLLPSRAWELFVGALVATLFDNSKIVSIRNKYASCLAGVGLFVIFSSYLLFSPSTAHPSMLTIIPVSGAVLVIFFSSNNNLIGRLLSHRIMVLIGLMSYSLYLWHQPILALMKKHFSLHLGTPQIVTSLFLIFFLSYFTWKYIESPFRNRQKFSSLKIFKYSLTSILAAVILGVFLRKNLEIQRLFYPEQMARFEQLLAANNSHDSQIMYDDKNCKFWSNQFNDTFVSRFKKCTEQHDKAIFIIGGSHGMDLYNAVAENTMHPFVVSVSKGACRAHKFIGDMEMIPKCQYQDFVQFMEEFASNVSQALYTQTPDRLFDIANMHRATEENLSVDRIDEVVNYLTSIKETYAIDVAMVGMLPPLIKSPINWSYELPFNEQFQDIISDNAINLTQLVDREFEIRLKGKNIPYFSKINAFAIRFPEDLIYQGQLTYSDNRHISEVGERLFGDRFVRHLNKLGYEAFIPVNYN